MSDLLKIRGSYLVYTGENESKLRGNLTNDSLNYTLDNKLIAGFLTTPVWESGGALATARGYLAGAGASNTAALAFGGCTTVAVACTESYNGTSWTAGGTMATARYLLAGAGASNTAALAFGGYTTVNVACTESYNGTSWTAGGTMGTARYALAGAGTNTAALAFGGYTNDEIACTESYNGTSWTAGGNLGTARQRLAGAGASNTAALAFGGHTDLFSCVLAESACTEKYNGTSWTADAPMNSGRETLSGVGTNTAALAFGGRIIDNPGTQPFPPDGARGENSTELYNGTSWTTANCPNIDRLGSGGAGTNRSALVFGGTDSQIISSCTISFAGVIKNCIT